MNKIILFNFVLTILFCRQPESDIKTSDDKVLLGNVKFEDANPKTFEVIRDKYAKDGKNIYYYDSEFSTLD